MDEEARRICEAVTEACGLVGAAESGESSPRLAVELEQMRSELIGLAAITSDDDAADAACGVISDIDRALRILQNGPGRRAA